MVCLHSEQKNLELALVNNKQTAEDQVWNSALSFVTKDKQPTIASFQAPLSYDEDDDDDDDDEQTEQKSTFGSPSFYGQDWN